MEKRKLSKSKVESYSGKSTGGNIFSLIVKVKQAGYMPPSISLRKKITAYMITANATQDGIKELETDKLVESFSVNKGMQGIQGLFIGLIS